MQVEHGCLTVRGGRQRVEADGCLRGSSAMPAGHPGTQT